MIQSVPTPPPPPGALPLVGPQPPPGMTNNIVIEMPHEMALQLLRVLTAAINGQQQQGGQRNGQQQQQGWDQQPNGQQQQRWDQQPNGHMPSWQQTQPMEQDGNHDRWGHQQSME